MALPMMVAPAARNAAIASLSELLGDRLSTGELVRQQHGRDASYHPCVAPDAVAFAQSTEEVSDRQDLRAAQGADYSFRQWQRLGRQCRSLAGWGEYRYLADE